MIINYEYYDALEVHAVKDLNADDPCRDDTYCEVCQRSEADFFSVYGHLKEGGVECLFDFPTELEAVAKGEELSEEHCLPFENFTEEG